jgi:RNA polymerase sigma factor (sigma-70 family)
MAMRVSAAAMEGIYTLYRCGAMGTWSDSQLVAQFLTGDDGNEAAFRVLIHRHGPMVLGVCRRVLGDDHAAEDAFQTTFLVLVEKASVLKDCNRLANWLYGVALRVASKERVKGARRRCVERQAAGRATDENGISSEDELRSVIDEEIRRLPERYRVPLVLCHMQGLQHDEVARQLGCPIGTVESRLSRAREQLRARLARRGLAPSASAMGAILRPPATDVVAPPLIEATLRAASIGSAQHALLATGVQTGLSWLKRTVGFVPMMRAATVASTLVVAAGVAVMGLAVYRAEGEPAQRDVTDAQPPSIEPAPTKQTPNNSLIPPLEPASRIASSTKPAPAKQTRNNSLIPLSEPTQHIASSTELNTLRVHSKAKPTSQIRFPSALAPPLTGITIDGRLDDWPKNLKKYAIENQLLEHPNYNSKTINASDNPNAYFMAGYDLKTEQIYLAVVVRDKDVVVHPTEILNTDAVEIYIDGDPSVKKVRQEPFGDWHETFNPATMPVLQYVGVPGKVSAYADPWNANPSLLYAQTKQNATTMKYQRNGDLTTYEWSVKAFDRFPDRPTHLYPGKRLGLEVAVVDKDKSTLKVSLPPTFLTWGSPPLIFKGSDASTLGELILTGQP